MEASYVDLADPRHLEFDYLRRISSNTNRKVAVVAAEIAETRRVPDVS